jgi:hypothetical protein
LRSIYRNIDGDGVPPDTAVRLMTPTGRSRVGRSYFLPAAPSKTGRKMTGIPTETAIALWVAGSCWAIALVVYLFDGPPDLIFLVLGFGALTGVTELILRKMKP